jgi:hypothetical protein
MKERGHSPSLHAISPLSIDGHLITTFVNVFSALGSNLLLLSRIWPSNDLTCLQKKGVATAATD